MTKEMDIRKYVKSLIVKNPLCEIGLKALSEPSKIKRSW
jgi:hypothetical protein